MLLTRQTVASVTERSGCTSAFLLPPSPQPRGGSRDSRIPQGSPDPTPSPGPPESQPSKRGLQSSGLHPRGGWRRPKAAGSHCGEPAGSGDQGPLECPILPLSMVTLFPNRVPWPDFILPCLLIFVKRYTKSQKLNRTREHI